MVSRQRSRDGGVWSIVVETRAIPKMDFGDASAVLQIHHRPLTTETAHTAQKDRMVHELYLN